MTLVSALRLWPLWLALGASIGGALAWGHYVGMRNELAETRAELKDARARVEAFAEAARIRRKSDETQARLREEAAALDHDLDQMGGGDAPLSDYLTGSARRVWP